MNQSFHAYCDESCHLEHDRARAMVLGTVWCPASHRAMLARKIKAIKQTFGLAPGFEIKWAKVSPAKFDFYQAVIDLFLDETMLHFRALVVPNKQLLDHQRFKQSHDDFYYKLWYMLLNPMLDQSRKYRIFLDIKDTQCQAKVAKLHHILCDANHDHSRDLVQSIEVVHSHDVLLLQLTDLLIGAVSYANRQLRENSAKVGLITHLHNRLGMDLDQSTELAAGKFSILVWEPKS